ncbi:MAG: mechanosensitive ion channel family protein [Prevotella sp.]|jgi:small conductance mechanosensitive channel|nr:mechanosensitive ion channel family protein [Prevotella sp.]
MQLDIIPEEVLPKKELAELPVSAIGNLFDKIFEHAATLGLKFIAAVVVFIIGRWFIRWLRKFIGRFLEKRQVEATVKSFLDSLANITLQIILFLSIVNIMGISMMSFAAVLAAAGLAIGMAMKDNLSNFAGGVMLLINQPVKVGNRIIAQGMDGTVQSVGILYTVLLTGDNRTIYIPNGPLSTGSIINFSDQKERRVDITFTLGYGADMDNIKSILQSVIKNNSLIKDVPAPFIGVTALNNGTLDITIRVWANSEDHASVNVDLNEKIYAAFRLNSIYTPAVTNIKMLKE